MQDLFGQQPVKTWHPRFDTLASVSLATAERTRKLEKPVDLTSLRNVINDAKKVAKRYRKLTGKPLGITGEVGEFYVADLLGVQLTEARHPGYDAVAQDGHHIQIKARRVIPNSKRGQRVGRIKLDQKWDTVALILLDENYDPLAIYEAPRRKVQAELKRPGSKARNERGALSVTKFKDIAKCVWPEEGPNKWT